MGKWVADDVLDGALQVLSGATKMVALAAQPGNYAAAVAGRLAEAPMLPADFQMGAGDSSGRKVTIAAKSGIAVSVAGVATHVALLDASTARLLYVTTCPEQALVAGGEVSFDSWSVEIGAPL